MISFKEILGFFLNIFMVAIPLFSVVFFLFLV